MGGVRHWTPTNRLLLQRVAPLKSVLIGSTICGAKLSREKHAKVLSEHFKYLQEMFNSWLFCFCCLVCVCVCVCVWMLCMQQVREMLYNELHRTFLINQFLHKYFIFILSFLHMLSLTCTVLNKGLPVHWCALSCCSSLSSLFLFWLLLDWVDGSFTTGSETRVDMYVFL